MLPLRSLCNEHVEITSHEISQLAAKTSEGLIIRVLQIEQLSSPSFHVVLLSFLVELSGRPLESSQLHAVHSNNMYTPHFFLFHFSPIFISVAVLCGELLREAEFLVNQRVHPMTIMAGWRQVTNMPCM